MKSSFLQLGVVAIVYLFCTPLYCLPLTAINNSSKMTWAIVSGDTTLYVGGTGPGNYSKIQDAIDNATHGDTVFVFRGFYQETVHIGTSIHLTGEDKNTTIIDAGQQGTVIEISAHETILKEFTVQHAKNDIHYAGVEIGAVSNVVITQNIIKDNGWFGISARSPGTSQITIDSNSICNNSYGLCLRQLSQVTLAANTIHNNTEGLYIIGLTASQIQNNIVVNKGLGVHVENCYELILFGNYIDNNANGIYLFDSSEITIEANMILRNRWYGLWLKDTTYSIINGNSILDNIDVGLFLESSYDTSVTNNTVWDNDNGIYLKDSAGNIIQNNNLRNYKMSGCFVSHTFITRRNIWKSNYWERARIIPYPIFGYIKLEKITLSWMNIDWTPLQNPPRTASIQRLNHYNGTIRYVGGNGPNNYSSIQAAVDDAQQNDTIYVYNGTYYEAVRIDKSLCLTAENTTTTILEGNGTWDIITILADYVTINNFTIHNGHFNILVNHSSYTTITGNTIGGGLHGVSVQNECEFLTISKNAFQDNVYGIRLYFSSDATVSYNSLQSFKINAFYYGTAIAHGRHHWYQNYWGRPRHLPCVVPGKIRLGNLSLFWINVDWFPLTNPI
ncbi:MAG: hypothetical protein BV458_01065 [Thermoplasmata archaeon M9B2D]|nr:MAG: hypothetical protein BV458_01065 [Thermoplasmata archaeon M9B2D]